METAKQGQGESAGTRPAVTAAAENPEQAKLMDGSLRITIDDPTVPSSRDGSGSHLRTLEFEAGDTLPEGFSVWTPAADSSGPGTPVLQMDVPRVLKGSAGIDADVKPRTSISFKTGSDCTLDVYAAGVGAHAYEDGKSGSVWVRHESEGRGDTRLQQGGEPAVVVRTGGGPGGAYGHDCKVATVERNGSGDGPADVTCPGTAYRGGTGSGDANARHPDARASHTSPGGGRARSHEDLPSRSWENGRGEAVTIGPGTGRSERGPAGTGERSEHPSLRMGSGQAKPVGEEPEAAVRSQGPELPDRGSGYAPGSGERAQERNGPQR